MIDWKAIGYAAKKADMETPVKYGLASGVAGGAIAPFLYWLMTDKDNFRWRKFLGSGIIGAMASGAVGAGVGGLKEHVLDKLSSAQAGLSRTNDNLNARLEDLGKIGKNIGDVAQDAKGIAKNLSTYSKGLVEMQRQQQQQPQPQQLQPPAPAPNPLMTIAETKDAIDKAKEFGKDLRNLAGSTQEVKNLKELFKSKLGKGGNITSN